ncbi:very short patch repair endonuclease [Candidatus Woesearchaeota archaeon]|nr:very short patch repair endonuclease [Candidatus Woesearchaeota archaeon]
MKRLSPYKKEYWINKGYTEEESNTKLIEFKKNSSPYFKEYWIKRGYTEKEALKNISTRKKETSCFNKEFWIKKGYNEKEAIEKVRDIQINNSKKVNNKSKSNPFQKTTWINRGFSEKEAQDKINEIKNSQNIYKNFNEDELNLVLEKRKKTYYSKSEEERKQINKSRGRTKKELIKKFGEEYVKKISLERGKGRRNSFFRRYSKISNDFFQEIERISNKKLLYGDNEKWIRYNSNKGFYVDCLYNNKIIEFNGDFYHANPEIYEAETIIEMSKTKIKKAKEIWWKDQFKIKELKEKGYDILVIWEKEVVENREKVIKKCLKFLKNG